MLIETIIHPDFSSTTLTCYLQQPTPELRISQARPAVLIFPGGAYKRCSAREAEPVALAFLAEGYQAFVLRYSVGESSRFPRPLLEAQWAYEIIQSRAAQWMIRPDRISAIGFSAGGHLAAALGTMGTVRPHALLLGYPCILKSISSILANPVPGLDREVDPQTPPTFLFTTCEDATVPVENSLAFADALNRQSIPFELHIFQHGRHGLSLSKEATAREDDQVDPVFAQWFPMGIRWLDQLETQ